MSETSEALDAALIELGDAMEILENIPGIHVTGSRIPWSWVQHSNGSVALDVSGNIVMVILDEGFSATVEGR